MGEVRRMKEILEGKFYVKRNLKKIDKVRE